MLKQTPLGFTGEVREIGEDEEVQCKLCDLICKFAKSEPAKTLNDLIDYYLLDQAGLCEEHILRLSMRYERTVEDCKMDQNEITVEMVYQMLPKLLPLAVQQSVVATQTEQSSLLVLRSV